MTAQELRIGNWVWNETQQIPVQVDIKILQEQLNSDKGFGESWQPIPLTEERLLKCGFEKLPITKFRLINAFKIGKRFLYFDKQDNTWCINSDDNISSCYNIGIVEYLHELQNVYYFTSKDGIYDKREELEIKL